MGFSKQKKVRELKREMQRLTNKINTLRKHCIQYDIKLNGIKSTIALLDYGNCNRKR